MKKKVYIHIGYGKTGTSSIQDMMYHNRDIFKSNGLYYPEIGLWNSSHHGLTQLPRKENHIPHITENLHKIRNIFVDSDDDKLLISSENLCFSVPELVKAYKDVFNVFDVQILMYVRKQEKLIPSVYLEWIKNDWDYKGNITDFFQFSKMAYDFLNRVSSWEEYFGRKSIRIRVYDKRIFDDVSDDFLHYLGLDHLKTQLNFYRSNLSLSVTFCKLVSIFDSFNLSKVKRDALINELLKISNDFTHNRNDELISPELKKEIIETYTESNIELAKRYLNNVDKNYFLE